MVYLSLLKPNALLNIGGVIHVIVRCITNIYFIKKIYIIIYCKALWLALGYLSSIECVYFEIWCVMDDFVNELILRLLYIKSVLCYVKMLNWEIIFLD